MRCVSNQSSQKVVLLKNKPFRWNFIKTLDIYTLPQIGYPSYTETFRNVRVSCFNSFFRCAGKIYPPYSEQRHRHICNISSQVYKTQPVHRIFSLASCQTLHTSHRSACYAVPLYFNKKLQRFSFLPVENVNVCEISNRFATIYGCVCVWTTVYYVYYKLYPYV